MYGLLCSLLSSCCMGFPAAVSVGGLHPEPAEALCSVSTEAGCPRAWLGRQFGCSRNWLRLGSGHFSALLIGPQSNFRLPWDKPMSCWLACFWSPESSIHHRLSVSHQVYHPTAGSGRLSTFPEEKTSWKDHKGSVCGSQAAQQLRGLCTQSETESAFRSEQEGKGLQCCKDFEKAANLLETDVF